MLYLYEVFSLMEGYGNMLKRIMKENMLCRYIQQKYGYSEKRSRDMVDKILPYNDIFEEFFNYTCVGKFCKLDKSQTEICEYTAEVLNRDFNLSPLGAYNFLVYLKEEPERAIADLKAGLPRKQTFQFCITAKRLSDGAIPTQNKGPFKTPFVLMP